MTQIIVLTSEPDAPQNIGIISGDMSLAQAEAMCQAAARHFREQAIEAEVVRRLSTKVEETDNDKEEDARN